MRWPALWVYEGRYCLRKVDSVGVVKTWWNSTRNARQLSFQHRDMSGIPGFRARLNNPTRDMLYRYHLGISLPVVKLMRVIALNKLDWIFYSRCLAWQGHGSRLYRLKKYTPRLILSSGLGIPRLYWVRTRNSNIDPVCCWHKNQTIDFRSLPKPWIVTKSQKRHAPLAELLQFHINKLRLIEISYPQLAPGVFFGLRRCSLPDPLYSGIGTISLILPAVGRH